MKPTTLQKTILDSYRSFFSLKQIIRRILTGHWRSVSYIILYKITLKPLLKHMQVYLNYLAIVEEGMYDDNEKLIEEKLPLFSDITLNTELPVNSVSEIQANVSADKL